MANTIQLSATVTVGAYTIGNDDPTTPNSTVTLTITSDDATTSIAVKGTKEQVHGFLAQMLASMQ